MSSYPGHHNNTFQQQMEKNQPQQFPMQAAQAASVGQNQQFQGYSPQQTYQSPPPYSMQGNVSQVHAPQGYVPQGYVPQNHVPQGYVPQGYVPQGYVPQGYVPQGYVPQGYIPQGYVPQGYVPQGSAPGNHPPQQYYSTPASPIQERGTPSSSLSSGKVLGAVGGMLLARSLIRGRRQSTGSCGGRPLCPPPPRRRR